MVATKITVVSDEHQNCVGWGKKERKKKDRKEGFFFFSLSLVFMSRSDKKRIFTFSFLAVNYRDTFKQELDHEL